MERRLGEEWLGRVYRGDAAIYAEQVLGVEVTRAQEDICLALMRHKRVMVKASHAVGKSFIAAVLTNWWFDCFDPSICLTTAPTMAQVEDVLWKEVRRLRKGRPGLMPKAARMETSPVHFAAGYTARTGDSFQGRHEERVLIIFDEAVGVEAPYWDAAEGMMTSEHCYWLCIFNPTDTASRAYQECESGDWHVITMSALDHPNIAADLRGEQVPYPAAVRLGWVQKRLAKWASPISADEAGVHDVEFPPGSGRWHRPGPLFESRVLGRWPRASVDAIWSEALWEAACTAKPLPQAPLRAGCDVARFGDDDSAIHVARGRASLHHVTGHGWSTSRIAGEIKRLICASCEPGEDPRAVEVRVDTDGGWGAGVVDQAEGWNFIGVSASASAMAPDDYPNVRSELWFANAEIAGEGRLDLSRLTPEARADLRRELLAPTWKVDSQGRRVVEPKEDTKKRLGRSPDNADAFNLCHYAGGAAGFDWIQLS